MWNIVFFFAFFVVLGPFALCYDFFFFKLYVLNAWINISYWVSKFCGIPLTRFLISRKSFIKTKKQKSWTKSDIFFFHVQVLARIFFHLLIVPFYSVRTISSPFFAAVVVVVYLFIEMIGDQWVVITFDRFNLFVIVIVIYHVSKIMKKKNNNNTPNTPRDLPN